MKVLSGLAATVTLGLAALLPAAAVAACPAGTSIADYVPGGGLCLAAATYGASGAGASPALVVVLHGDVSSGGPADYHFATARSLAGPGVVAVALVRPGYSDSAGRVSEGSANGRRDHYTATNINAVADAIAALKTHYKARRVVVLGHSGG